MYFKCTSGSNFSLDRKWPQEHQKWLEFGCLPTYAIIEVAVLKSVKRSQDLKVYMVEVKIKIGPTSVLETLQEVASTVN